MKIQLILDKKTNRLEDCRYMKHTLRQIVDARILEAYESNNFNIMATAKELGIGRATLYRHLGRLDVHKESSVRVRPVR